MKANVKVLGDTTGEHASRTVVGSSTEVRQWVFAAGVSLGAPMYRLTDCVDGRAVYNMADQTGNWLVDADGNHAGLMMRHDLEGNWTATMRLRYLAT